MQTGRPAKHPRCAFGERLNKLREQKGLTLAQVAVKLGISLRAYAFWERKPVAIKPEQLAILCELFETSADYLIGSKQSQKPTPIAKGRLQKIIQEASDLPRSQREKIIEQFENTLAGQKLRQQKKAS